MKKMFRLYFLFSSFFLITITYPQENYFENLLIQKELNPLTYFEAKKAGKNRMIYGIIGLAVIVAMWGLVNILLDTFNIDTTDQTDFPTVIIE